VQKVFHAIEEEAGRYYADSVAIVTAPAGWTGKDWEKAAGFLSSLATNLVLKRGFGRERPSESNGETVFRPGSKHDSFPSGHSTEAFAVASVVAARADGWVIPAVAYTAATLVAFDRVNKRVHFASDVYAGAIIGTFTGRMIVHRHQAQEKADERKKTTDLELVPIRNGLSVRLLF
jgi:PAP2 superfamily